MNRHRRPEHSRTELINAILGLCTLDDTHTRKSLEALDTQSLQHTYKRMQRLLDEAIKEHEEREEARSRQMPSWAMSENERGPDPRDGVW